MSNRRTVGASTSWAAFAAFWIAVIGAGAFGQTLAPPELMQTSQLRVAIYNRLPPFSSDGEGIDVEIARAIAQRLGVKLVIVPFEAGEELEDDLRNMVLRGHYLGWGPADVMMHAPVDRQYAERNKRVKFVAPYFRDEFQIARAVARIPTLDSLDAFAKQPIGVEGDTLPDVILLGADGGRYRQNLVHFKSTNAAIDALEAGQVAAVFARRSELQARLRGASGYEIGPAPLVQGGVRPWAIGLAIKSENENLARALQQAMDGLRSDGVLAAIFAKQGVHYVVP